MDKEILSFLNDITINFHEDKKSFDAIFHFKQNSFFDETEVKKTYFFNKKDDCYDRSESTEIKWKDSPPNKKTISKKIKSN